MMMYGMKDSAAVAMVGVGGVRVHMDEATEMTPLLGSSAKVVGTLSQDFSPVQHSTGNKVVDVELELKPSQLYFASFNCGGLEKMG